MGLNTKRNRRQQDESVIKQGIDDSQEEQAEEQSHLSDEAIDAIVTDLLKDREDSCRTHEEDGKFQHLESCKACQKRADGLIAELAREGGVSEQGVDKTAELIENYRQQQSRHASEPDLD